MTSTSSIEDFECGVCSSLLFKPVTTPCGHTFCQPCLVRTLDHQSLCPTCRATVYVLPNSPINVLLLQLIKKHFAAEYDEVCVRVCLCVHGRAVCALWRARTNRSSAAGCFHFFFRTYSIRSGKKLEQALPHLCLCVFVHTSICVWCGAHAWHAAGTRRSRSSCQRMSRESANGAVSILRSCMRDLDRLHADATLHSRRCAVAEPSLLAAHLRTALQVRTFGCLLRSAFGRKLSLAFARTPHVRLMLRRALEG